MNINRHNYESFFLLYTDNELDTAGRKAVEDFVEQNPDLAKELVLLQQTVLPADEQVVFAGKGDLFKGEEESIHAGNYEVFFVAYADDELSKEQKRMVESFVYHHPQYQGELQLLQAVHMEPDTSVVFGDKQRLYRKEENDDKVVPFRWWRLAAAAVLLLVFGLWWMSREKTVNGPAIANKPGKETPARQNPNGSAIADKAGQVRQHPADTTQTASMAQTDGIIARNNDTVAAPGNADARQQPASGLVKRAKNNRQPSASQDKHDQIARIQPTQQQPAPPDDPSNPAALPDRPHNTLNNTIRVNARPALIAGTVKFIQPDENLVSNAINSNNEISNNDRIAIMNTSVKRTALRGFLRKASRVIAKKTSSGDDDDDNQKHILIGSFAIAVK